MKTFEEPVIRMEKFAAESVMTGDGTFRFLSGVLGDFDSTEDRTHSIFARPY